MFSSTMHTMPRIFARQAFSAGTITKKLGRSNLLIPSRIQARKPMSSASQLPTSRDNYFISKMRKLNKKQIATGGLIGALCAQSFFGSASDFYEYRFIVKKDMDPDDLASFYGSEEFMEIFCMVPIVGAIMMRGGYFDDDGVVHTYGFPGELLVSMAFTDETNSETEQVDWFNKRERFKNVFLGYKMWDQVSNFGFHTLPNGRIEVYHHGEYFVGRLPIISLGVKIAFQIQARIVAWATEHHLNHRAFISKTDEEEEIEHLSRTNHLLYFLKYHLWSDFKGMVGFRAKQKEEEKASFLSLGADKEEEEMKKVILPTKHTVAIRKIQDSLVMDKELMQEKGFHDNYPEDMHAYDMARNAALVRHQTLRLTRRKSTIHAHIKHHPTAFKPIEINDKVPTILQMDGLQEETDIEFTEPIAKNALDEDTTESSDVEVTEPTNLSLPK